MTDPQRIPSTRQITETAERLYENQFRNKFERVHKGKFLAIDVVNEVAYLGKHPEDALEEANRAVPGGTFYLVRIGETAAFNVGYTNDQKDNVDRPLRRNAHRDTGLQPA